MGSVEGRAGLSPEAGWEACGGEGAFGGEDREAGGWTPFGLSEVVGSFVKLFNDEWLVEKNGLLSPHQAREAWHNGDLLEKAA